MEKRRENKLLNLALITLILLAITIWVYLFSQDPIVALAFIGVIVVGIVAIIVACLIVFAMIVVIRTLGEMRKYPRTIWMEVEYVRPLLVWVKPVDQRFLGDEGFMAIHYKESLKKLDHLEVELSDPRFIPTLMWVIRSL